MPLDITPVTQAPLARLRILLALLLGLSAVPIAGYGQSADSFRSLRSAQARVHAWIGLLALRDAPEWDKIDAVHRFFGTFVQQDDRSLWGVADRWVMPEEFVRTGAGDCEDFAIAQFATLVALGVPAQRLALAATNTYLPEHRRIEHHMVLVYRPLASASPWIIDNRSAAIVRIEERADLGMLSSSRRLQALELRLAHAGRTLAATHAASVRSAGAVYPGPVPESAAGLPASLASFSGNSSR